MESWFDESVKTSNHEFKRAIVFIHGLNGSRSSWIDEKDKFVDTLRKEKGIYENYGLYIFQYPTKIAELTLIKKLLSIIPKIKKNQFNVSIRRTALMLKTNIDEILRDYSTVIVVAHSMGGLVSKKMLVEMQPVELKKVKLFMSLSVPHSGAPLANFGLAVLGDNKQLADLKIFSDFAAELANRFSNLNYKPKTIYQTGSQDIVVPELSAIPEGVLSANRIDTGDDHYSILRIQNKSSHAPYLRLIRELKNILALEQEESPCRKANEPVSFNIPENASFKLVAEGLTATANCTIKFIGFETTELAIVLKSRELSAPNTYQALKSLRLIGQEAIPDYEIIISDCNFQITKL
jgi:hypothetical protein